MFGIISYKTIILTNAAKPPLKPEVNSGRSEYVFLEKSDLKYMILNTIYIGARLFMCINIMYFDLDHGYVSISHQLFYECLAYI